MLTSDDIDTNLVYEKTKIALSLLNHLTLSVINKTDSLLLSLINFISP